VGSANSASGVRGRLVGIKGAMACGKGVVFVIRDKGASLRPTVRLLYGYYVRGRTRVDQQVEGNQAP
jgi:hypothetical protein